MRYLSDIGSFYLKLLSVLIFTFSLQTGFGQETDKSKVRLNGQYVKIMKGQSYIDIKASAKVDKKNISVSGIDIAVYNELDDEQIDLGTTTTNHNGKSRFFLKDFKVLQADSSGVYTLGFAFEGNELYSRASNSISFKDVNLIAKMVEEDSIHYMEAQLMDMDENPVVDLPLKIQVQRLINPYLIGEEFNMTDENGIIFVPITEQLPGVDGKLIFEVVLYENDDYGTVKALVESATGIPIVDESNFDERTMWSTRDKTPIFLLIFPNLLILVTWGLILYLLLNLIKIYKAKT
jgi:5-hydroxyisourate hydrolase-like protein (transthyretin family)